MTIPKFIPLTKAQRKQEMVDDALKLVELIPEFKGKNARAKYEQLAEVFDVERLNEFLIMFGAGVHLNVMKGKNNG